MNLREFLKQNKALTKFKANYAAQRESWPKNLEDLAGWKLAKFIRNSNSERFIKEYKPKGRAIADAFLWEKTPEEFWYWDELQTKWEDLQKVEEMF
jgi:hypothetical protein